MNFADKQKKKAGEQTEKNSGMMEMIRELNADIDVQLNVSTLEATEMFAKHASIACNVLIETGVSRGIVELFRAFCGEVVAGALAELAEGQEEGNGRNH